MAKTDMMCPFSGRLCEECSLYRGRHYYLCFCEKYRGYLSDAADDNGSPGYSASRPGAAKKFEIPAIMKPGSAIDPFAIIMRERNKKEL